MSYFSDMLVNLSDDEVHLLRASVVTFELYWASQIGGERIPLNETQRSVLILLSRELYVESERRLRILQKKTTDELSRLVWEKYGGEA